MKDFSQQDSQLIDKFLLQKLTDEEQQQFDVKLNDTSFAKELSFRKTLLEACEVKGNLKLQSLLESEDLNMGRKNPKNKLRWIVPTLMTVLFLTFLIFYIINSNKNTSDKIFLAHYEPFPNLVEPIQRSQDQQLNNIAKIMLAYDSKNYKLALKNINDSSHNIKDLEIYEAICNIETQNIEKAKIILTKLTTDRNAKYHDASQWYLALIYLKENDLEKAITSFKNIAMNRNHLYRIKAEEILERL